MFSWQPLGKHLMRIEEDVIFVIAQGELTGDEVVALCEQLLQIQHKYGWVFEIFDARGGADMSAEARRQSVDWCRHHCMEAEVVAFGIAQPLATLFALMMNAIRLLGSPRTTMHFVATEVEAKAWVAQRRLQRRAEATG